MADGPVARQYGLGYETVDQWQTFHDSLLAYGGIARPVAVDTVFTNRILDAIYQKRPDPPAERMSHLMRLRMAARTAIDEARAKLPSLYGPVATGFGLV